MSDVGEIRTIVMDEFKRLLTFSSETKLPFCVWGEKAVGKTTGVYDWAAENGYNVVTLHLATQDVVDLIGMMNKETDEHGRTRTVWSRPEWMLHEDDERPTVYFLDEFNRGNNFVLAAMLPFLIEGTMHTHKIGKNHFVVAACNPTTGNYNVNDSFEADDALRDRCGHVILSPTDDEFLNYAESRVSATTLSVVKKAKRYIELKKFKLPFSVTPSRRSLINVMKNVDKRPAEWIEREAVLVLQTYLGNDFCNDWLSQYSNRLDNLSLDVLMNFKNQKTVIENAITTHVKGKPAVRNDVFESAQDQVVQWLEHDYKDGIDDISWLIGFLSIPVVQRDSIVALLTKFVTLDKPHLYSTIHDSGLLNSLEEIEEYHQNEKALEIK